MDLIDSDIHANETEFEGLSTVIRALQPLVPEARHRIVATVSTFLGIPLVRAHAMDIDGGIQPSAPATGKAASESAALGPKEFLHEKRPQTDVERIACLAYYLTHHRGTPQFKTVDLGKLNSEAAQLKFSNAAYTVANATQSGWLVPTAKGRKQISALGELYVQALPDRAAAREAVSHARKPRKVRTEKGKDRTVSNRRRRTRRVSRTVNGAQQ